MLHIERYIKTNELRIWSHIFLTLSLTVLSLRATTSCRADDQAAYIARLRANPTEDFSGKSRFIKAFADADAMIYFQDHRDSKLNLSEEMEIGRTHASQHHLKQTAYYSDYSIRFATTLEVLAKVD
jgi:hypothetical protein